MSMLKLLLPVKIKFLILFILTLGFTQVFSIHITAQFKDDISLTKDLKILPETPFTKKENNLRNIPFALGLEAAFGGTFGSQGEVYPGGLFFIDLNLSKKVFFLKAEYGKLFFSGNDASSNFASFGLNCKITEDRKHNFYLHGGAFGIWGKPGSGGVGGGAGFFLAFRYRYSIADQVGFVTSLRYPMGNFKSIMVTAGLQFFTF